MPPCHGGDRGFESHHPRKVLGSRKTCLPAGRDHGFKSRPSRTNFSQERSDWLKNSVPRQRGGPQKKLDGNPVGYTMNFNNTKERIERILTSLGSRFDYDIKKHIKVENKTEIDQKREKGMCSVTISFGNDNKHDIENKILIILHNLNNLKNCLEFSLIKIGLDGKTIVENKINQSLHLQTLVDLVNQEKHGYPLPTNKRRSNKNPTIKDIRQNLRMSSINGSRASFTINPSSGTFKTCGDNSIAIDATIYDDTGKLLFHIDELVTKSFDLLNKIAADNKLI